MVPFRAAPLAWVRLAATEGLTLAVVVYEMHLKVSQQLKQSCMLLSEEWGGRAKLNCAGMGNWRGKVKVDRARRWWPGLWLRSPGPDTDKAVIAAHPEHIQAYDYFVGLPGSVWITCP